MNCLIKRDDKTIAYINKIHNYNPKGTPRPKFTESKLDYNKKESINKEIHEILKLFL